MTGAGDLSGLFADGQRVTGLDLRGLLVDGSDLTAQERDEAGTQVTALAGCLWNAAIVLVEQLFDDLEAYVGDEPAPEQIENALILGTLPPQYAADYTRDFARQYLAAAVDLTGRLAKGWRPPTCFAQELQLHQLLSLTATMVEVTDADVPFDWRAALEAAMFDGPTEFAPNIAPPVSTWFVPRGSERLPPYCEDTDD